MNIPNLLGSVVVDETGHLTPEWRMFFSQLVQQMQQNLSQEGFVLPQQNTTNITKLNTQKSTGAMLYNSDTNQAMVNVNGVFEPITTSITPETWLLPQ